MKGMKSVSIAIYPHCVGSMERINPLTFAFIRNDPLLPATIGSCILQTDHEIRPALIFLRTTVV